MASGRRTRRMDRHKNKLGAQTGRRLDHRPLQAPRLEGAGGVHAPLQHQVGGLSAEPKVASRNRERWPLAKRNQARQLGVKPNRPKSVGSRATEVARAALIDSFSELQSS